MKDNVGLTGEELGLTAVRGRVLIVPEIAKFLRMSERWVRAHMDDGTFPFRWFPISPYTRGCDSADLDDWLKKTVVKPGNTPAPLKAVREIKSKRG